MNILFVDDQPNVLSSLLMGTNWRAMGFSSVFSAVSVSGAKAIIEKHPIDILVTDIEMPGEDGISLLYWIREKKIEMECVILSSHADFFYAQQAIAMKVTDFVVQPARTEDIVRAVEHAMENIRMKQPQVREKHNVLSAAVRNTVFKDFVESWPYYREFAMDQHIFEAKLNELGRFGFRCEYDTAGVVLYVHIVKWMDLPVSPADFLTIYEQLVREYMGAWGEQSISYSAENNTFITVFFDIGYTDGGFEEKAAVLRTGIREKLHCMTQLVYAAGSVTEITDLRMLLMDKAPVLLEHENAYDKPAQLSLSSTAECAADVRENCEAYFIKIRDYIRKNMGEPVSRVQIANALYLSPGYVSFIIKKVASCSCRELITKEKMEYAKYLLNNTRKPVGDVALDCGFNSFAYFSKVYKDYFRIKPSDERREE